MKTNAEEHFLAYGERRIPYRLELAEKKRLRIVVRPDKSVIATAPKGFSDEEIRDAVQSKARWIVQQIDAFEEFHPLPTPHRFVSGETFVYLGRQYRLRVESGKNTVSKLIGRYLHVQVPDKKDSKAVRKAVDTWYRTRAADVFPRYLASCMQTASRHGIEKPVLKVRDMRTRWGSCTANGLVTLNLRLIHAPVHCIEYVVMHELCHLVYHDHSPNFFRLLTRCMPDWKKRREVLSRVVVHSQGPAAQPD